MATGVSANASCDLRVPGSLKLLFGPLALTVPQADHQMTQKWDHKRRGQCHHATMSPEAPSLCLDQCQPPVRHASCSAP
ncbi:uncharacterized [Tachysurus ichikawai]